MSSLTMITRNLVRRRSSYGWCCKQIIQSKLPLKPCPAPGYLVRSFSRAPYPQQQLPKSSKQIHRKKFRPSNIDSPLPKGEEARNGVSTNTIKESRLVTAYCVAQSYDMNHVWKILSDRGMPVALPDNPAHSEEEPQVIHLEMALSGHSDKSSDVSKLDAKSTGDVFIFPSGTIVSWDVPRTEVEHLTADILLPAAQEPLGENAEDENLEYMEDPQESKSEVRGETIVLGTQSDNTQEGQDDTQHRSTRVVLAKIAYSSGLARATKLSVLENLVDEYSQSSRSVLSMLNGGPMARQKSRRWIYSRLGQILDLRAQLNLYSELADDLPDLFWDTKQELGLEAYYDQVGRVLDVLQRIKILNKKMDYAEQIISNLRDMRSETHSSRLEWIIIWLITFEVLHIIWIEVRRLPQEREMVKDSLDSVTVHG